MRSQRERLGRASAVVDVRQAKINIALSAIMGRIVSSWEAKHGAVEPLSGKDMEAIWDRGYEEALSALSGTDLVRFCKRVCMDVGAL